MENVSLLVGLPACAASTSLSQIRPMFETAESHSSDLVLLEIGEPNFATSENITRNMPCFLMGWIYDSETAYRAIAAVTERDASVIVEEIYEGPTYDGNPTVVVRTKYSKHALTINGYSKKYAMMGSANVVGPSTKLHKSTTSWSSTVIQQAAIDSD